MIKNNVWNRIFHHKELEAQEDKYFKCQDLVGFGPETLHKITQAKDLIQLLQVHKLAWSRGYQNENLGPCEYGMFRTDSIPNMSPSEVYLGNIWGLWTFNIVFWDQHKEDDMAGNGYGIQDNVKCYDLIMQQYRTLLKRNVEKIIREAQEYCHEFDKIV